MYDIGIISQQILNGLVTGSGYILVALGLTLIFGVYRIINMAHGAVYMWGAFFCQIFATRLGLNFYLATIIAMVLAGFLSVFLERIVFRKVKGQADWVALVAGLGIYCTLENLGWIVLGPRELHVFADAATHTVRFAGFYVNLQKLILAAICLVIVVGMIVVLKKTSVGRAIRAASSDSEAALLVGINTNLISTVVFFLGGAFAAVAGCLLGSLTSVAPSMGFAPMIMAFVIVVFGGMGSILGTVIAGLMVGVIQNLLAYTVAPSFAYAFTMLILLAIFIVKPTGLFGEVK
jgi:branched-chain amino acid transport system permease protein